MAPEPDRASLFRLGIPRADVTVDVFHHQLTGVVRTDDFHGQVVIPDLLEQGGHLQEFERIVGKGHGDFRIDDADMVVDGVLRTLGQILLVFHEILGSRLLLAEILGKDLDVFPVRDQFRPHQLQSRLHGPPIPPPVLNPLHRERDHDAQDNRQHSAEKTDDAIF